MKNHKSNKAFTLVELIVVITILAILATIAFISFQGSARDANNTKVISDVRNLVSKVNIQTSSNIFLEEIFLSWSTTNKASSLILLDWKNPIKYDAGYIDFWILEEDKNSFKDNDWNRYIYSFAYAKTSSNWSSNDYSYFQVAGQLIDNNWVKTALIKGNYTPMVTTDSPSLFSLKNDNNTFLVNKWDASDMY